MTKFSSKIAAAALAIVTLGTAFAATSGQAQAHSHHFGPGLGIGFAAGALIGAAAVSSSNYYGYRECRYVDRLDRWGNVRTIKVCEY